MTEYELDRFCENNPYCNGRCMSCRAFGRYTESELGWDEHDDEDYD